MDFRRSTRWHIMKACASGCDPNLAIRTNNSGRIAVCRCFPEHIPAYAACIFDPKLTVAEPLSTILAE